MPTCVYVALAAASVLIDDDPSPAADGDVAM